MKKSIVFLTFSTLFLLALFASSTFSDEGTGNSDLPPPPYVATQTDSHLLRQIAIYIDRNLELKVGDLKLRSHPGLSLGIDEDSLRFVIDVDGNIFCEGNVAFIASTIYFGSESAEMTAEEFQATVGIVKDMFFSKAFESESPELSKDYAEQAVKKFKQLKKSAWLRFDEAEVVHEVKGCVSNFLYIRDSGDSYRQRVGEFICLCRGKEQVFQITDNCSDEQLQIGLSETLHYNDDWLSLLILLEQHNNTSGDSDQAKAAEQKRLRRDLRAVFERIKNRQILPEPPPQLPEPAKE